MQTLWQDIRYGIHMLRKGPGFTAIALITLAVGIAANTTMFSVADLLFLRPVQVREPEQLVCCSFRNFWGDPPYSAYITIRDSHPVFRDLMAQDTGMRMVTVVHGDSPRQASAMFVSSNYFPFLGVAPQGRGFLPQEQDQDAAPVLVLSHRLWQRLGGAPNMMGQFVSVNGVSCQVIGIAPEGFTGVTLVGPDLWLPLGSYLPVTCFSRGQPRPRRADLEYPGLKLLIRLEPGLSMTTVQTQLQSLLPRLKEIEPRLWRSDAPPYVHRPPRISLDTEPDGERMMRTAISLVLLGVSGAILLIACLNLANMLIVQGASRHREIAIRLALGSGRLRIIRQLLIESLLLALSGGTLGLVLAFWGIRVLRLGIATMPFPELGNVLEIGLNLRVVAATLAFSLIATMLFGLRPALSLSRRDIVGEIKESGGAVLGPARRRRGGLAVLCQTALAVVLVMGAAMFTRSALCLARPNPRFPLDDKLIIQLDPLSAGYDRVRSVQVCETLAERLASLPGVKAVGMSPSSSFGDGGAATVCEYVPGETEGSRRTVARWAAQFEVGRDYFTALEIPLLQGRSFDRLDRAPGAEKVVIIDETLARKLRPDGNALGCWIQYQWFGEYTDPYRVVGIVPNVQNMDIKQVHAQTYIPLEPQKLSPFIYLHFTDAGSAPTLTQWVAGEIRKIDPRVPVLSVETLGQKRRDHPSLWLAGLGARLAMASGAAALFLAALGIYAIKGHMVASRSAEIGIRMALGATRRDVLAMVLREGTALTLAGLLVGLLPAFGLAWAMRHLLYGTGAIDPASILTTLILLGLTSLVASYVPARRAARIDPMATLRAE